MGRASVEGRDAAERADLRSERPGGGSERPGGGSERPTARERVEERAERARLTFRRLAGLDRSGPPPPQTLAGQPWNPWTLPNAIGFVRLALIPLFLGLAFSTGDGVGWAPAGVFAVIAFSDYLDGIAARLTGQFSRLGTLLDPLVDRLLVVAGFVVCWNFELLPRWAIAALMARELIMLAGARVWLRHGLQFKINWSGRLAVWPTMAAILSALVGLLTLGEIFLYLGLALSWTAALLYLRGGVDQLRERKASSSG